MLQQPWDYLIVTASHDGQAAAYEMLLDQRRRLKLLGPVRHALVIPDPEGQRVGSGGSTVYCLLEVLRREAARLETTLGDRSAWRDLLASLRILIVHAGGDSKRLPAYGPCGKIFLPVPGESHSALPATLFDRQLDLLLALPDSDHGRGQLLVTSGDVLLQFDPRQVRFDSPGITALGCRVTPKEASHYGVYRVNGDGRLQKFLQKPPPAKQHELGVVDRYGQSLLDIGVMNFDADAAIALLDAAGIEFEDDREPEMPEACRQAIAQHGLDLYREICCAFGCEATIDYYRSAARQAGSTWDDAALEHMYEPLNRVQFSVRTLVKCNFLHFGTTRQLIHSGQEIAQRDQDLGHPPAVLLVNSAFTESDNIDEVDGKWRVASGERREEGTPEQRISNIEQGIFNDEGEGETTKGTKNRERDTSDLASRHSLLATPVFNSLQFAVAEHGSIIGKNAWIEGCRIGAEVTLGGNNVLIGVDVNQALEIPAGGCVDVLAGKLRDGRPVWFVRCYGIEDQFKDRVAEGATFCNLPVREWLGHIGANVEDVWPDARVKASELTVWDARLFPAVTDALAWRDWMWLFEPQFSDTPRREMWRQADRYSLAEMALLTDLAAFHDRRSQLHAQSIYQSIARQFRPESGFSAADLVEVLRRCAEREAVVSKLLEEARACLDGSGENLEVFAYTRIMHTLGSAIERLAKEDQPKSAPGERGAQSEIGFNPRHSPLATRHWPAGQPLATRHFSVEQAGQLKAAALNQIGQTIIASTAGRTEPPQCALRPDETVWGRSPARIDLGGGWTDTPPFTLERGGTVINAAINLNGQPPIHCYARVIEEPVVRLSSIDLGRHVEISQLEDLLDYRNPQDEFGLAKAALAISGFSPQISNEFAEASLREMLTMFGGGIELTTLVGIPKGSGLGTSSIVGATILAVIQRVLGRSPTQRELFHDVLRLEQALTTGGGWQDQVGGVVRGVKLTTTQPGMFPDPTIHFLPGDLLDPQLNGGTTLLYYTGLTRLAKNILERVVAGYLDRDRSIMTTMSDLYVVARYVADAMSRHDAETFGHAIDESMRLNIALCPEVTNPPIEQLIQRIKPHIYGSRIPGAGSGGFLLLACKSPDDAAAVRRLLEKDPLNERSRFFDFDVSTDGLVVTTC